MTIMGFKPRNHPQQIAARNGAVCDVTDDRRTPVGIFQPWDRRYRFTLDAAASDENAKCSRYFTLGRSGLEAPWSGERVWCNPPFSQCAAWVNKAWNEMRSAHPPEVVVMLLPANRTEQRWWQLHVEPYRDGPAHEGVRLRCTFLQGRPRFIRPDWTAPAKGDRPPFGCCVLVWERAA